MATTKSNALLATAYHEAGHAVAAHVEGGATKRLTIIPEGDALGSCHPYALRETDSFDWDMSRRNQTRIERSIIGLLGGWAAEARFSGRRNWVGARSDWHDAVDLATRVEGGGEVLEAYLAYLRECTRAIFESDLWWAITTQLAEELVERRTMSAKEVRRIVRQDPLPLIKALRGEAS